MAGRIDGEEAAALAVTTGDSVFPGPSFDFAHVAAASGAAVSELLQPYGLVIDSERTVALDHGALRFQPQLRPGWGRQGVAIGPFAPRAGLAFSASVLNGHHASADGPLSEPLKARLNRWLIGPGGDRGVVRLLGHARRPRRTARQLRRWVLQSGRLHRPSGADENLGFGWFATAEGPAGGGEALFVRGEEANNGALALGPAGSVASVAPGLRNLPLQLLSVWRGDTVAYYAGVAPATLRCSDRPGGLRPLGIVPARSTSELWATLQQAALGQIGFRVDTRVHGLKTAWIPAWADWWSTAEFADRCTGNVPLECSPPGRGVRWSVVTGSITRTPAGASAGRGRAIAIAGQGNPGLVRVVVQPGGGEGGLLFRAPAMDEGLVIVVTRHALHIRSDADHESVPVATAALPAQQETVDLQVLRDGGTVRVRANGVVLECPVPLPDALEYGLSLGGDAIVRDFEAHPSSVGLPAELGFAGMPTPRGETAIVHDRLTGGDGPLQQRRTGLGAWERTLGRGTLIESDDGVRVDATIVRPNPGRTAYTLPWSNAELADIAVTIVPPGERRGQGENGRGGVIFWQDADNYVIVNNWLDDGYPGASISSFFRLDGYEDIYEAVWTNVGSHVRHGVPHVLRVGFDGLRYVVSVDGTPVLYRSLTDVRPEARRLRIRRVGIVANWEWGDDTGTTFRDFTVRA